MMILIITENINGLNAIIKNTEKLLGLKKITRPIYMQPTRD